MVSVARGSLLCQAYQRGFYFHLFTCILMVMFSTLLFIPGVFLSKTWISFCANWDRRQKTKEEDQKKRRKKQGCPLCKCAVYDSEKETKLSCISGSLQLSCVSSSLQLSCISSSLHCTVLFLKVVTKWQILSAVRPLYLEKKVKLMLKLKCKSLILFISSHFNLEGSLWS